MDKKKMDGKMAIDILQDLWCFEKSEKFTENEIRYALSKAIEAIRFQEEITNIVNSADMIIEEIYGCVIVEGYSDVFNLINEKVKVLEVEE